MSPTPPTPRKDPKTITQLGRTRTDDYAWMKDDNWQAVLRDPTLIKADVKEHLTAENAYREAMLALLDEHFESPALKAVLSVSGVIGAWAGPRSPGTATRSRRWPRRCSSCSSSERTG